MTSDIQSEVVLTSLSWLFRIIVVPVITLIDSRQRFSNPQGTVSHAFVMSQVSGGFLQNTQTWANAVACLFVCLFCRQFI